MKLTQTRPFLSVKFFSLISLISHVTCLFTQARKLYWFCLGPGPHIFYKQAPPYRLRCPMVEVSLETWPH